MHIPWYFQFKQNCDAHHSFAHDDSRKQTHRMQYQISVISFQGILPLSENISPESIWCPAESPLRSRIPASRTRTNALHTRRNWNGQREAASTTRFYRSIATRHHSVLNGLPLRTVWSSIVPSRVRLKFPHSQSNQVTTQCLNILICAEQSLMTWVFHFIKWMFFQKPAKTSLIDQSEIYWLICLLTLVFNTTQVLFIIHILQSNTKSKKLFSTSSHIIFFPFGLHFSSAIGWVNFFWYIFLWWN